MNGVRSISMRKGFLLTALAAAVLLAASSGTAYAQSVGFVGSSGTVMEGASGITAMPAPPAPFVVDITISGLTVEGEGANGTTGLGTLSIEHDADAAYTGKAEVTQGDNLRVWIDGESSAFDAATSGLTQHSVLAGKYGLPTGQEIDYDRNGTIRLLIIDPEGDGNWV